LSIRSSFRGNDKHVHDILQARWIAANKLPPGSVFPTAKHVLVKQLSSLRRGAGVAEQGCLLSSYTPKGCRGFESPPLRHLDKSPMKPQIF
jgi:hypothetical protein